MTARFSVHRDTTSGQKDHVQRTALTYFHLHIFYNTLRYSSPLVPLIYQLRKFSRIGVKRSEFYWAACQGVWGEITYGLRIIICF